MIKKGLLICAVIVASVVSAQTDIERQKIIEKRIEFIGDNLEDSEIDLTTFFDDLYMFYDSPINLNSTNFEELKRLHLLSDVQIQSILKYIEIHGEMITIYELNAIESIDRFAIDMLLPFVKVEINEVDDFVWKNAFKYGKHENFLRYERILSEKAGYIQQSDFGLDAYPNK